MKEEVVGEEAMEHRIQQAMRSRVQHFRDQADSLTFEGVRRVLEKDLELDTYALDVHKRYVKQLLEKFLNGAEDEKISKDTGVNTLEKIIEEVEPPEEHEKKEDVKELNSREEEKMEDSPVMGLLTGNKSGNSEAQGKENKEIPSESAVTKAIWKRAAYLKSKSEEITVAGVRRLLEEDLKLEKYSLDSLKKLIGKQLDEVLNSPEIPKSATPIKKKSSSNSQSKPSKKTSSKDSSDSSDNESDDNEDEEEEEAPKKKVSTKGKIQKSEGLKKRKRPTKESQVSRKKPSKISEEASKENSDGEDTSEDDQSQSSARKTVKKKEVSPPTYGKKVEHLKSIIKSCGMSVAPVVYKKAKQVPDNKREGFLIKELEEILAKEGLSADPSEKEIKDVKRRKDRAKELEGIDTSNIVLSSRRRSTTSFVAPPKPIPPVKKDEDATEGSDSEDSDEDDDDDDGDDSDSQSEEPQEDEDGSD